MSVQAGQSGRASRQQQSLRTVWLRILAGVLIMAALAAWHGIERRPTGTASGSSLNQPAAEIAASSIVDGSSKSALPAVEGPKVKFASTSVTRKAFRVSTYNIHSAVGLDGRQDLSRIADVLKDADIVGLNEVRGGSLVQPVSQVELLASKLQLPWLFAPTEKQWWHGHFGNGVLCRWPVSEWKRVPLAGTRSAGHRNAVVVKIPPPSNNPSSKPLHVVVTHLDRKTDREKQLAEVAALFLALPTPSILIGDLNTTKADAAIEKLIAAEGVADVLARYLPTDSPERIDWILARGLKVVEAGTTDAGPSDHPHFWAEFEWPGETPEVPAEQSQPSG